MRNRLELIARCLCGLLAVVLVVQLPGLFSGGISLSELKVPEPPATKAAEANETAKPAPPANTPRPVLAGPPGVPMRIGGMPGMPMPGMPMPGMPGMPPGAFPGRGGPRVQLPPEIQAKVDFIVNAELLGPVPHPLPMALLGIAGNDVILRAPNGQVGLVAEGGELGGVKLLQIGTNRILIEHEGQKKELMLFSGYGGDTLLSQEKETTK